MYSQKDTIEDKKSGNIDIQTALLDTEAEIITDFKVDNMTLIGSYTQLSFEVQCKKLVTLPNAINVTATQRGHNLKQSIHKGICSVYKGGQTFKGSLINKEHTLNSDINYVLLKLKDGTCVKINHPERIHSTPDTLQVYSNGNNGNIKINMLLENAIISEFRHTLNEVLALTKGDDDREPGFYLEQTLILTNETTYNFRGNTVTKIAVPMISGEQGDDKVENRVLTLDGIGDLISSAKEIIVFSELKLPIPRCYNIISLVCHDKTNIIYEFVLPDSIYPGSITQYLPNGEVVNISPVHYTNKGEKIFLKQGVSDNIHIVETKTDNTTFSLIVENKSKEDEFIRLRENDELLNLKIDDVLVEDDIITVSTGIHTITGTYKTSFIID